MFLSHEIAENDLFSAVDSCKFSAEIRHLPLLVQQSHPLPQASPVSLPRATLSDYLKLQEQLVKRYVAVIYNLLPTLDILLEKVLEFISKRSGNPILNSAGSR